MSSKNLNSCFIIAAADADTRGLREALEERGVKWVDATSAMPAASISQTITSGIDEAQFVCAVLAGAHRPNVIFEIGIAVGRRIPVLAFVEPGIDLPLHLQNLSFVRTEPQDKQAIGLYLDAFLEHASPAALTPRPKKVRPRRLTDTSWAVDRLKRLEEQSVSSRGAELERLVADLFAAAGAPVSLSPIDRSSGADMAIWFDELEGSFGNPIMVEVKWVRLAGRSLDRAELQLRDHLARTSSNLGLLIYWDLDGTDVSPKETRWPLVIRLGISELVNLVGTGELAKKLLQVRNLAAHGSPGYAEDISE